MKTHWFPVLLLISFAAGCAHSPDPAVASAPETAPLAAKQQTVLAPAAPSVSTSPKMSIAPETQPSDEFGDITDFEDFEDVQEEKKASIADPLEPFNRSMYHFNDKLYFWVLKPVAQGYSEVVPEPVRIGVDNFFKNLGFPIRFVNCALQLNFAGAEKELGRFLVNTLFGFAGFLDLASHKEIALDEQDEDLGQTLGSYGIGQGFYINWPIFGSSSPRDTLGLVGDSFLRPFLYVNPWYVGAGARVCDLVNATSLRIGDYEALQGAAIDPYVAIRDAYVQYRLKKIELKGKNATPGGTEPKRK